ncbi:MAG: TrkA C-terminal domain-containing protein, partial [Geitlerinemataceae cyanobacterium]
ELNNEWIALKPASPLVEKTLAEADIRNLTGVTVMAIRRGDNIQYYPSAQTKLKVEDTVLVVGKPEEVAAFHDLTSGLGILGTGYNRWVTLTEESKLVGCHPKDVESQYDVNIQAIRRHGKLYYGIDNSAKLLAKDCVLFSGSRPQIESIKKRTEP